MYRAQILTVNHNLFFRLSALQNMCDALQNNGVFNPFLQLKKLTKKLIKVRIKS